MEQILDFAQGPLFRFAFAILMVGLLRRFILIGWPAFVSWKRARDRSIHWKTILKDLGIWLFPVQHVVRTRQIYSIVSYLFHIGLLLVPLFLADHISLWAASTGMRWPALSKSMADILTLVTIAGAMMLVILRILFPLIRQFSNREDFMILVFILVPFVTGYIAGKSWNPFSYNTMLLLHVVSGNLLLILVPFTKLSHCILFPFSRLCTELGTKLVTDANYVYQSSLSKGMSHESHSD